jgi:hypothetical protein
MEGIGDEPRLGDRVEKRILALIIQKILMANVVAVKRQEIDWRRQHELPDFMPTRGSQRLNDSNRPGTSGLS